MKTELLLKFRFEASHSLAGREEPHPHLWDLEVSVTGQPIEGRIIDMVAFRERIESLLKPLDHVYLNDCSRVSPEVREFPTCETLSQFFAIQLKEILTNEFIPNNRTLRLNSIWVAISDLQSIELGAVRLSEFS